MDDTNQNGSDSSMPAAPVQDDQSQSGGMPAETPVSEPVAPAETPMEAPAEQPSEMPAQEPAPEAGTENSGGMGGDQNPGGGTGM